MLDEADHMADLGFLPAVRRLLAQTPRHGQRMLFSATLDNAIDVLVKRFLDQPVVHEADSAQSPVAQMDHHVLHVSRELRIAVLVDLASAPGRTMVFTRTKHGAKALARQLNKSGVPAVDLHGNLSQGARTRNLDAFHSGTATTLVATDIAARGIHVDDVDARRPRRSAGRAQGLPAPLRPYGARRRRGHRRHADDRRAGPRRPCADPRSGREADAHQARPRHPPVLQELAPGQRTTPGGIVPAAGTAPSRPRGSGGGGTGNRSRKPGGQRGGSGGSGGGRGGNRSGAPKAGGSGSGRSKGTSSRRGTGSGGGHSASSFSGRR